MIETLKPILPALVAPIIAMIVLISIFVVKNVQRNIDEKKCTLETQAMVISTEIVVKKSSEASDFSYSYPTFEYTVDGKTVTTRYKYGTIIEKNRGVQFQKGDKVTIFVNPSNLKQIYIPDDTDLAYQGKGYLIVAGMMLMIALVMVMIRLKSSYITS